MYAQDLMAAGIPLPNDRDATLLSALAALEWVRDNTVLELDLTDIESIACLPANAKLFVVKCTELNTVRAGVTSQSIEGLSLSFSGTSRTDALWELARSLLSSYLKSQLRVYPALRRW